MVEPVGERKRPQFSALHSGNTVILLPQHVGRNQHPEPCLDQDSEPQGSGLFLETHLICSCPQWLPAATDSSWPPRKLGKSIRLPDILFYHRSLPPWHPWPLRAVGTPPIARKGDGGMGQWRHMVRGSQQAQPPALFSLRMKTPLCSLCSLPPRRLGGSGSWQPLRATSHLPSPHFQSQQIHTEENPWALRAPPLLPSPWLSPLGWGHAQAPQR